MIAALMIASSVKTQVIVVSLFFLYFVLHVFVSSTFPIDYYVYVHVACVLYILSFAHFKNRIFVTGQYSSICVQLPKSNEKEYKSWTVQLNLYKKTMKKSIKAGQINE